MEIQLIMKGPIKNPFNKRDLRVELPEKATVRDLLRDQLQLGEKEMRFLLISVNGKQAQLDLVLATGDAVNLFLPLGGG